MPSKKKSKGVLECIGDAASSAAEVVVDASSKAVHAVGELMPGGLSKEPRKPPRKGPRRRPRNRRERARKLLQNLPQKLPDSGAMPRPKPWEIRRPPSPRVRNRQPLNLPRVRQGTAETVHRQVALRPLAGISELCVDT